MIIQALTDCEVYKMSYPTLKKIATENGTFAGELLRENCDLSDICSLTVSIRHLNHVWPEFAISYTSILQKSTRSLRKSRCRSQNLPALRERPLPRWSARFRILKKEGILDTSRKQIEILDEEKLLAHCTLGMRSNII